MSLKCEIDPLFKPKKGSQIQVLIGDVEELKSKIEMLSKNEHLLTQALHQHNKNLMHAPQRSHSYPTAGSGHGTPSSAIEHIAGAGHREASPASQRPFNYGPNPAFNDASGPVQAITNLSLVLQPNSTDNLPAMLELDYNEPEVPTEHYSEFILGDVKLPLDRANDLHTRFVQKFLPFLPIMSSKSASQLYAKSQLLFWTVMLTASLSEPEPTLYMSLALLIKQLAIETCWIRTPRSTHVIQALIFLSIWPLPNEKVLDDTSYRFVGLAKNLSLQLGLHRGGEFIPEFSRNQVSLGPDSDLWRTRSWLAVFFCDQFWSSALGLPPSINTTDYLLENARIDRSLPPNFRSLISLAIFQCKLVNVMGISVTRPDGLLEPMNRAASLNILDRELERLKFKLNIVDGSAVEIYYLYIRLMICCFAFLPGTPIEDQVKYVSTAYLAATRTVTIASQLLSMNSVSLIELPIYVRQAVTYSAFLLFKLHLSRYMFERYIDSARQSIVTVHRLYRNTLSSWKDLQNDISRTAKVLENLNIVLFTYPEIFSDDGDDPTAEGSIISRMRSHLTASLFYDLVWCIHEAKRRTMLSKESKDGEEFKEASDPEKAAKRPRPLPFYNQITRDDFSTIMTTTPNGTTITTLVPTDLALNQAKLANKGVRRPLEINGIPLSMLEATGSTKDDDDYRTTMKLADAEDAFTALSAPEPAIKLESPSQIGESFAREDLATHTTPGTEHIHGAQQIGMANQLDLFFQDQSNGWLNNNQQDDDFLGWIEVNMLPEH